KKDVPRLSQFLRVLPRRGRFAFEFRHESWMDEEVFDLLRQRRVALCMAEAEDGIETPLVETADWGYLRLRMVKYSDADLKRWIRQIRRQKWKRSEEHTSELQSLRHLV